MIREIRTSHQLQMKESKTRQKSEIKFERNKNVRNKKMHNIMLKMKDEMTMELLKLKEKLQMRKEIERERVRKDKVNQR